MAHHGRLPTWPKRTGHRRILFLLPELYASKGGIPVYNQNLLRAVSESFTVAEIHVVSINDWSARTDTSTIGRFHFTGCGPRSSWGFKLRVVLKAFGRTFRYRPDLIICGHINLTPLALALSLVSWTHRVLVGYGIEVIHPKSVLQWAARHFHRVLAISRYTANLMIAWGINPERTRILPVTVDGEVFRPMGRLQRSNGVVLLTVARLDATERYKGTELVIKALRGLLAQNAEIKYVVAGKGDDLPRLQVLAHEAGAADHVDFRGYVPDEALPALYNEADVFVMPSKKEGFGIVFLEALACGLPVIAGNRDGSVYAVLNGELGVLVDPEDERQINEAIERFVEKRFEDKLRDPTYLRGKVLRHYGFDRFRENVRTLLNA